MTTNPAPREAAETIPLPPMPPTDARRPWDENDPTYYAESDRDWLDRNEDAASWLADNHVAIRAALAPAALPSRERDDDPKVAQALSDLLIRALKFCDWAAGEGIHSTEPVDYCDPSEFITEYLSAIESDDPDRDMRRLYDVVPDLFSRPAAPAWPATDGEFERLLDNLLFAHSERCKVGEKPNPSALGYRELCAAEDAARAALLAHHHPAARVSPELRGLLVEAAEGLEHADKLLCEAGNRLCGDGAAAIAKRLRARIAAEDAAPLARDEWKPGDRVRWHNPPGIQGTVLKNNGGLVKVRWDNGEVRRDESSKLRAADPPKAREDDPS